MAIRVTKPNHMEEKVDSITVMLGNQAVAELSSSKDIKNWRNNLTEADAAKFSYLIDTDTNTYTISQVSKIKGDGSKSFRIFCQSGDIYKITHSSW
jgi:hypothetical protein